MVLDAALTTLVGFNMRSSEILLAALILPLASGTAPACKGEPRARDPLSPVDADPDPSFLQAS